MKQTIFILAAAMFVAVHGNAQSSIPTGSSSPQLSLPTVPVAYNANTKVNFVRVWEARKAITDGSSTSLNSNANFKTATNYFDGLGRSMQLVIKESNYNGTKDIVTMNVYDEFGRETKQYLPYAPASNNNGKFRLDAFAEQQAYYNANYQDQSPFTKIDLEASPLNRPLKTCAPGNSWSGVHRGVESQISANTLLDNVRMCVFDYTSGALPTFGNPYPAGDLIKSTITDEDGKQTIEYKDKGGKLILKKVQLATIPSVSYDGWANTYYVYDDFEHLRFVIQPKGVEWLIANGWSFSSTGGSQVVDELCMQYGYDGKGRVTYKKLPGIGSVYICYDRWGRAVFTQNANLRSSGKWLVIWYDAHNRPTSSALYNVNATLSQMKAIADALDDQNPAPIFDEYYLTRLNNTYYDEYSMPNAATYSQSIVTTAQGSMNAGDEIVDPLSKTDLTRGLVTGVESRVLNTNTFLKSTPFYDQKGHALQNHSTNSKGGTDITTLVYSFTEKLIGSYVIHNNPLAALPNTQSVSVFTRNTYNNDHLLKVENKINNEPWHRISELQYNDLGTPIKKMMGNPSSNFYVNNDYNVRGWLTGINKTAQQNLESGNIGTSTFYEAIFSEVLNYDYGYTKQYYNGNISGIKWANASDKQARSYGYEYDNSNRLMQADFTQRSNSLWSTNAGIDYSLMWMRYDANGNILNMAQRALKLNNSSEIDRLKYDYLAYSNKLMRVTDTLNDAGTKLGDFKDGINAGDDYAYDNNGNMTIDNNKDISNITYNHLNLPQTLTIPGKGTIEYVYDAGGNKLQKKVTEGTTVTTTDYVSGFVYQNNNLQLTGHEEGRIRYAKKYYYTGESAYEWHYDYFYRDHLGNIRAVVTEQKDTAKYMATFERGNREKENALFTNIEETAFLIHDINQTELGESCLGCELPMEGTNYPEDNTTDPNEYTSRLNGNGKRIGAAITLKVMAGDKIDLGVKVWYPESGTRLSIPNNPEDVLPSLINTLSGSASGLSGGKATTSELSATTSPFWAGIQSFLDTHTESEGDPEHPKAYLNWVLFDEQFKYVPQGSGFIAVPGFSDYIQTLANSNIPIIKSGYLFVYLSNETSKWDVFFDNLVVQHYTGPLSETTDYTPWGLNMKMIESKAFGRLENKENTFQGQRFDDELAINWIQFKWRNYDPQIGRFIEIDPLAEKFEYNSPYAFSENKVVAHVELEGKEAKEWQNEYRLQQVRTGKWTIKELEEKYEVGAKADLIAVGAGLLVLGGIEIAAAVPASVWLSGFVGGSINATISALQGESGYNIFKSFVSGAVSGMVFKGLGGNTVKSILFSGAASGAAGEATDQFVDILFGKKSNFDLKQILVSGGMGTLTSFITNNLNKKVERAFNALLSNEIAKTSTKEYLEIIKKSIRQKSPNMGDRALTRAARNAIEADLAFLKKRIREFKKIFGQFIETTVESTAEYMERQFNELMKMAEQQ